jgi:hypothetical protein
MFGEVLGMEKYRSRKFQVLFLRNDRPDVEIHEVGEVDYLTVQEHLEQGGSVFITSRSSQKIKPPRQKTRSSRPSKTRMATAFYLDT